MSCTNPRPALIPRSGGRPKFLLADYPVGKISTGRIVYLPCGNCLACRRERRQDVTVLQCCEASLHEENWFLTLTYDDDRYKSIVGEDVFSLQKSHIHHFVESMRKFCKYHDSAFRFYGCGEYGERYLRPHYHLSIFGLSSQLLGLAEDSVQDKRRSDLLTFGKISPLKTPSVDSQGNLYWQSKVFSDRWLYGNHKLYRANRLTFQYVAGYVTKKLTGEKGKEFRSTGRISEFSFQSRPSIGYPFFIKYKDSLSQLDGKNLVNDSLSIDDIEWRIPRIVDKWRFRLGDGHQLALIKELRSLDSPLVPDRDDLKRKADFDRYSAERYKDNNRSHKEVT